MRDNQSDTIDNQSHVLVIWANLLDKQGDALDNWADGRKPLGLGGWKPMLLSQNLLRGSRNIHAKSGLVSNACRKLA